MAQTAELQATLAQIAQIDRRVDGIRLEVFRRGNRFFMHDTWGWQLAWDRHPDLHERQTALYRQRGQLQLVRDREIEREYQAEQRRQRAAERAAIRKTVLKRCDACGEYSRVAA